MNFFRTLLTGKDNASYEIIKLVIVIMLFSFIFVLYEGVSYYLKAFDSAKTFDILTLFNATGVIYSAFTYWKAYITHQPTN